MENKHSVASDSSEKKKVVTLRSSDGEMFEVEEDVFMEFLAIKPMLEECSTDGDAAIPLLNITGQTLAKVIEFCKKHIDHDKIKSDDPFFFSPEAADKEIKAWDKKFINVDQKTLFDLILSVKPQEFHTIPDYFQFDSSRLPEGNPRVAVLASNFLNVKSLLDLTCKTVAEMMRGRTPEEIRKTFHIKNDYTSEEEAEVRRENHWAFE